MMEVGKGMRRRKHCSDHPLALQRDFILLSRAFQLSLELCWPPIPPSSIPDSIESLGYGWDGIQGGCTSLPALGMGTRGVWGARPPRAGAANAALNSQHGAGVGSAEENQKLGDHRLQSPNEEPSREIRLVGFFLSLGILRWKQTQKFSFALFRSFPSVCNW